MHLWFISFRLHKYKDTIRKHDIDSQMDEHEIAKDNAQPRCEQMRSGNEGGIQVFNNREDLLASFTAYPRTCRGSQENQECANNAGHELRSEGENSAAQQVLVGRMNYSSAFCDDLRTKLESRIIFRQSMLKDIQLWENLNQFGDNGPFTLEFMEDEFAYWLNYATDSDKNTFIEERLARIPFEQAYCHKNPEFYTKSRDELLREVFKTESNEWRDNPGIARDMSIQDKLRIIKRFEYMCYYTMNRRDELIYDICDFLAKFDV